MRRIRGENKNTAGHFNHLFQRNPGLYNNYLNIRLYDRICGLGIFRGQSYLDFGCAEGSPLNHLKSEKKGLSVIGVDISDYCIQQNRKNYPACVFHTDIEFLATDFKIDHILSSHTFEHLEEPKRLAEHLLRRANRTLTIIVPYRDSWSKCDENIWAFDEDSFDWLEPSLVFTGIPNEAGNTEIVYHWDKSPSWAKRHKVPLAVFRVWKTALASSSSLKALLMRLLRRLKRLLH